MPVVMPRMFRIDRGPKSEALYELERVRTQAIQACAAEWVLLMQKLNRPLHELNVPFDVVWDVSVPQALFDALEAFQPKSSIPAAAAFLHHYLDKDNEDALPHRHIGSTVMARQLASLVVDLSTGTDAAGPCWCPNFGKPDHDEHTAACSEAKDLWVTYIKTLDTQMLRRKR